MQDRYNHPNHHKTTPSHIKYKKKIAFSLLVDKTLNDKIFLFEFRIYYK